MAMGDGENVWRCPDLGTPYEPDGEFYNIVDGSETHFLDCPSYYLRMSVPAPKTLGRRIQGSTADHLIGGHTHPALRVFPVVQEMKAGACRSSELSTKMLIAARLAMAEMSSREEYLMERARKEREAAARRR